MGGIVECPLALEPQGIEDDIADIPYVLQRGVEHRPLQRLGQSRRIGEQIEGWCAEIIDNTLQRIERFLR